MTTNNYIWPAMHDKRHRFGFNGQEKDDEITGVTGSHLDFGARIYDSRIGRWLSMDPLTSYYPDLSPYCFAGNTPIMAVDKEGKYIYVVVKSWDAENNKAVIKVIKANSIEDLAEISGASTLYKTESGKALIDSYMQDSENDIYLTEYNNSNDVNEDGNLVGGITNFNEAEDKSIDENTGFDLNKVDENSKVRYKNFKGIVPRKDAKTSSFIAINQAATDVYTNGQPLGSDNISSVRKGFAKTIAHEIFAHVKLSIKGVPVGKQHEVYGEKYQGNYTKEGSDAERINNEIDKVE
jgi:RHS repeat-associated protein